MKKFPYFPEMSLLLGLMLIRCLLYSVVIPVDRSPDEGYYFRLIKAKQWQFMRISEEEIQRKSALLAFQFHYLLYPTLDPNKHTVDDFAGAESENPPSSLQAYYLVTAGLLQLLALDNFRDEVFVIRGFSIFCGLLIVWLAFLTTRELFPGNRFLILGVPVFIAFLPQFTAMSAAVDNDKLTKLCLAVMFWLLTRIMKRGLLTWPFALYVSIMAVAVLGKRTAVFTIPLLPLVMLLPYWRKPLDIRIHLLSAGVLFLPIMAMLGLMEPLTASDTFIKDYIVAIPFWEVRDFLLHTSYRMDQLQYYAKFFTVFYWSFWGLFGYMTIHIHHFWYIAAALWHLLSLGGLGALVWRVKKRALTLEPWQRKTLYVFGVSIVYVILIVFLRSVVLRPSSHILSQGRRLFAVIIPVGVLTVLGLEQLFPPKFQRWVGAFAILGLFLMDTVILSRYLCVNFHALALF